MTKDASEYNPIDPTARVIDPDNRALSILEGSGLDTGAYNVAAVRSALDASMFLSLMWQKPMAVEHLVSQRGGPGIYVGFIDTSSGEFDPMFAITTIETLAFNPLVCSECTGDHDAVVVCGRLSQGLVDTINSRIDRAWDRQFQDVVDPIIGTVPTFKEAEQYYGKGSDPGKAT